MTEPSHTDALAVVLAAGKGTRMRSDTPKVMHPVAGRPMVSHVLKAVEAAGVGETALVVSKGAGWADAVASTAQVFVQEPALGTAHAVLSAKFAIKPHHGAVVVLFADNPLVRPQTIARMLARVREADVAVLAFETDEPTGYGRILTEPDGTVVAIREEKDASEAERAVRMCNSGIMAFRAGAPLALIDAIGNDNAKGEYYLTDAIALARAAGMRTVLEMADLDEVMGVNDRAQLAAAEAAFQRRKRAEALHHATLHAPDTVHFAFDTVIEPDATIEPNVVIGPRVVVGRGAIVRAFSHLEGVTLAPGAVVGPFARLRPGTSVGAKARIGNFVEVKNAAIADGAKVNHLSYIGDASVGADANVGAGTITCNYDGKAKHRTEIGAGAFIGSNSALVAPVRIGDRAFVGSGSVITEDVPDEALALGRGRQVTKPDRSPARRESDAAAETTSGGEGS